MAVGNELNSSSDPATGDIIGAVPDMNRADVKSAIADAHTAFKSFRNSNPRERARILHRWWALCMENADDLAKLVTWENGKPLVDAKSEVTYGASFLEWFSEEACRTYGDTIPASIPGNRIMTIRQPIGVVGIVTPWNFPIAMITRKVGAAVAAGCTMVIKPAAETPYSALALCELAERAGVPKGVINILPSLTHMKDVGLELTSNKDVRKISFTGSTAVGKLLMEQASSTVKKCSFELGGNAPFIVFDDADLDLAVAGAVMSKFRSSGQTCVCANRIYVQSGVYEEFSKKLASKVNEFKIGSGFKEGVTLGPLFSSRALDKIKAHIEDAKKGGAKVILGGEPLPDLGPAFWAPTVITGMKQSMRVSNEETFGPVAALYEFNTEDEVIEMANGTEFGLASYFYSKDIGRVYRVMERIETGMVGVNTGLISDAPLPFGGVKESGFGREGSKYGLDDYMVLKAVTMGNLGV